ncbi:MAG: DUF3445 domain-containing protein, partial [Pseudomonadota bacterium]
LVKLAEDEWLQPEPDLAARAAGFAAFPEGVQLAQASEAPGRELAGMLGVAGGLLEAAASAHEDMCLLQRFAGEEQYRLIGAAVAWPTDWHPKEKLGLPLRALHAPIAGYEEQLATGVDRFMETLRPGLIFGRCNWFIAPTGDRRWIAEGEPQAQFAHVAPANAGETLWVRSERQTLRRLPETGAILFTIGVYTAPLASLSAANTAAIAQAAQTLIAGESDRRGALSYADALATYADQRGS